MLPTRRASGRAQSCRRAGDAGHFFLVCLQISLCPCERSCTQRLLSSLAALQEMLDTCFCMRAQPVPVCATGYPAPVVSAGGAAQVDRAQAGTGDNHAISALKFKIIREFLQLGWHVLLSDVDIVVVQARALRAPPPCACGGWSHSCSVYVGKV